MEEPTVLVGSEKYDSVAKVNSVLKACCAVNSFLYVVSEQDNVYACEGTPDGFTPLWSLFRRFTGKTRLL